MAKTSTISRKSYWAPLAQPMFRALWIASTASNIGTWMQNVGAAWLMTSLNPSPVWIALVQTATSLPIFFLGVPAGVFADLVDRRRLLLVTQTWMLIAAALLGVLTLAHLTTPLSLLLLTTALGIGAALNAPAWQAIVPELVPREDLPAAIAINSVGFNIARAVGPAITGLLLAVFNPGIAFVLNALSFVGVLWVLFRWKREGGSSIAATERAIGAMRAGFRYLAHTPPLQAVLVRTGGFIAGASALWSLLAAIAKFELGGSATDYGLLLGCLGTGSICGALVLPRIRSRLAIDEQIAAGTIVFGLMSLAIAVLSNFALVCAAMLLCGMSWMLTMSGFNTTTQSVVPEWIRARALAFYLLVFQGTLGIGGYLWGVFSDHFGIRAALGAAGITILIGIALRLRFPLAIGKAQDISYADDVSQPVVSRDVLLDTGPVMVTVEYDIDPTQSDAFVSAMQEMKRIRRRDGAMQWMLFQDTAKADHWTEMFLVDSWEEHMRQHVRATVGDRVVKQRASAFHRGDFPVVRHWIAR